MEEEKEIKKEKPFEDNGSLANKILRNKKIWIISTIAVFLICLLLGGEFGESVLITLGFDVCAFLVLKLLASSSQFKRQFAAMILMSLSVFLATQEYTYKTNYNGAIGTVKHWWNIDVKGKPEVEKLSLTPRLDTTLIALLIYSALFMRGFFALHKFIDYIILILNVLFIASLLGVIIGVESVFCGLSGMQFAIIAILFSWLGIRAVSGFIWLVVILISSFNLIKYSEAMEIAGAFYLIFAYISLALQLRSEEFRFLLKNIGADIRISGQRVSEDIRISAESTTKAVENTANIVKKSI